ncbi:hypothetical protein K9B35_00900 [Sphingomonas sp. R647]|uniref:hypothetical protein n=1 Tax=Sphingomonas sp. R647 TaxID=2875233 RepID=UPI001CD250CF|nr:hypothetical protein [Sphingomonas sp. R647]MCA1196515.1 hypothetical protein [Sphingomonas sp. R647]
MRRIVIPIYAGITAIAALLLAQTALISLRHVLEGLPLSAVLLIVAGWSAATFFAPLLSFAILARRRIRGRLLAHAAFVPCAIFVYGMGAWLFFAMTDTGGENLPAGFAMVASVSLLFLTLLFHAAAIVWIMTARPPHPANGT